MEKQDPFKNPIILQKKGKDQHNVSKSKSKLRENCKNFFVESLKEIKDPTKGTFLL